MKPLWGKLCWQHSQTGDTPLWERRSKSWEETRLPKELWERTVGCSQKNLPGKAGGIETTLSRFCLCIANSNIAECCVVISHPEIPTERTNLHSPGCCFAAMQIYGLFFTVPLPHLLHILSCATWDCGWRESGWLNLEAGTTWYLSFRVEKLIVCIKLLLLLPEFSSHTARGGQDGDKFSPHKRGQQWDTYTAGCVSAVLQMYSNRWPETLYCHHAQKGQSSSRSLWPWKGSVCLPRLRSTWGQQSQGTCGLHHDGSRQVLSVMLCLFKWES